MVFHEYEIVGRRAPTEKEPNPKLYRMKIFAKNDVVARSRFWYYLSQLHKLKKYKGQILSCKEIFEKKPDVIKNYGIWIRYNSRSGTHNMYKEYRETTLTNSISRMYAEMASRHRARFSSIQIIRTGVIPTSQCRRSNTLQFLTSKIKFPLPHKVVRPAQKKFVTTFKAKRPSTYF
eukprot:tig00000615_g2588.t1